jgi:transposase
MTRHILTWSNRSELAHRVVTLHTQGLGRRAIARALQVSRNTVRKLLVEHDAARDEPHDVLSPASKRAPRASKLDPFESSILELLERYPDITAQRVFERLRDAGFDGGGTIVKDRIRVLRPAPPPKPSLTTPTFGPGKMAESDWSSFTIRYTTGLSELVQILSYVLVFSRRKWFSIHDRCDVHALMAGHVGAFGRFDGCAHRCKYDNQKAVVLRWEGSQPIYNPRFLAFATHYEFRPVAVRPYHPDDKPRTERSFWELTRSFLNGRSFRDRDDLQHQLTDWLDRIADHRRYQKRTALERFAEERDVLVPLPRHPYDTARVVYRVCSIDGFVAWDGNQYAVPYDYVTQILPVRITEHELFVYGSDLTLAAHHEIAARGSGVKVDPTGIHPPPQRKGVPDLDQLAEAFEKMGEGAHDFFQALAVAQPRWCGYHARQILRLRERYATSDIDRALAHARAFGAFDHEAVARILAARAAPRTLEEYVADEVAAQLERRLGPTRTTPRDLAEYDRLPVAPPPAPPPQTRSAPTPSSATTSPDAAQDQESSPWPEEALPIPPIQKPSDSDSSDT